MKRWSFWRISGEVLFIKMKWSETCLKTKTYLGSVILMKVFCFVISGVFPGCRVSCKQRKVTFTKKQVSLHSRSTSRWCPGKLFGVHRSSHSWQSIGVWPRELVPGFEFHLIIVRWGGRSSAIMGGKLNQGWNHWQPKTRPAWRHTVHCGLWTQYKMVNRNISPIFSRYDFRENIWRLSSVQFHFCYIFGD